MTPCPPQNYRGIQHGIKNVGGTEFPEVSRNVNHVIPLVVRPMMRCVDAPNSDRFMPKLTFFGPAALRGVELD